MKKHLFFLLIFIAPLVSKSQVNLQLNRVITYAGTLTSTQEVFLDTVPVGKVWKIEAIGPSGFNSDKDFQSSNTFTINGKSYCNINFPPYTSGTSQNPVTIKEVIWLKSGDFIGYKNNSRIQFCLCPIDYFVSILEFNLN